MNCVLQDKKQYKKLVYEALKTLGKKNCALIVHGSSFPSDEGKDVGFGTPNSNAGKRVIDFAEGIFNAIQLGPQGKTKGIDSSPYTGTIFSSNPLFIDLEQLTTEKWDCILSETTFTNICNNNPNKDTHKTAYSYIFVEHEKALREAFENFNKSKKFKKEYEKFKKENAFWLEKDSLYEALIVEHQNDYYPMWKSDMDKRLFNPYNEEEKETFANRIEELKLKYQDIIEFYCFCQFVAFEQNEQTRKYAKKHDIKMIADRQVAFSDRDAWAYQAYFLDGWCLGCPPDYFSKDGQAWGFPVMNPEMMFNKDGSLGKGGELMKKLYKKMFTENPGGVRIDHIVGLIDPWVYVKGHKPKIEEGAGRLYSSPEHPFLSRFAIATLDDLNMEVEADKEQRVKSLTKDQVKKYGAFIEKIVIAAAKECGLDKDAIVCEDLGTLTYPVEKVMKEYKLNGMRLTQFVVAEEPEHPYRGSNIDAHCWAMVGTHDNEPIAMWAKNIVNTPESYPHAKNLVEDFFFELDEKGQNDTIVRLTTDAQFLTQTKLVEIFASKAENVQVFFTDLLGMMEVYNRPGTSGDKNWSLRMPNNFEEFYCEQLKKGLGLNFPLILKLAIEARGSEFAEKNHKLVKELEELI